MNLTLRPGTSADTARCGAICYEAFKTIADRHQFSPDFPSPQAAVASTERRFSHASYYAVVAEREGRIVGSVFLDERSPIASVASITVDPAAQNRMIGRRLRPPLALPVPGYTVRGATKGDIDACNALCVRVHRPLQRAAGWILALDRLLKGL
jgi:hypothetical protein